MTNIHETARTELLLQGLEEIYITEGEVQPYDGAKFVGAKALAFAAPDCNRELVYAAGLTQGLTEVPRPGITGLSLQAGAERRQEALINAGYEPAEVGSMERWIGQAQGSSSDMDHPAMALHDAGKLRRWLAIDVVTWERFNPVQDVQGLEEWAILKQRELPKADQAPFLTDAANQQFAEHVRSVIDFLHVLRDALQDPAIRELVGPQ